MRRLTEAILVLLVPLVVLVAACGSSEKVGAGATGNATSTTQSGTTWKEVSYLKATVQVPSAWPVYDLSADPSRCVRFDQHAVYLGPQGADASCPAGVLGRTDAVQLEPLDAQTSGDLLPGAQTEDINGLSMAVQPYSQTTHSFVAVVRSLGIVITVTWSRNETVAQRILNSVRAA